MTALVAVICLVSAAAVVVFTWRGEAKLKVFHAGSLTAPMRDFIDAFAEIKPGVTVENEVSGSVAAIRKVTELNRTADVVMVADYKLILEMMMPEYADFCLVFASNSMVLAYTDNSKLSGEINVDNWWEILLSDGVKVGFSNPNDDPCG
ncbi:MAG: tungstate ABC transporter substrate-binding protein WtpA, partial [Thermoprotei archaeon]